MTAAERRRVAEYLRSRRLTPRQIAEELGVSVGTVHRDLNPEAAERYRIASREHRRRTNATDQE